MTATLHLPTYSVGQAKAVIVWCWYPLSNGTARAAMPNLIVAGQVRGTPDCHISSLARTGVIFRVTCCRQGCSVRCEKTTHAAI